MEQLYKGPDLLQCINVQTSSNLIFVSSDPSPQPHDLISGIARVESNNFEKDHCFYNKHPRSVMVAESQLSVGPKQTPMFAMTGLRRIAVVYANSKDNASAVVHATANTRHWKSYQAVAEDICETLQALGLDVVTMPDGLDLADRLKEQDIELVWLNTGGVQGESPMCHTPALLESAGIPYIGHSPLNAAMLDDKGMFKLACRGLGLSTAPFVIHSPANGPLDTHSSVFRAAFGDYQGPFIVKPVNGRASQNVEYVDEIDAVPAMVCSVAGRTNCLVLVEKYLPGKEYCIAVMGAGDAGAVAFSPVERCLAEDEKVFTSMDVKAITTDRVRVMDPVTEADAVNKLAALGTAVYNSMNVTSLIRLDIRADEDGELFVLEANPKPDLKRPSGSNTSLVCTGLPYLGWDYQDLITCLFVERLWQLQQHKPYMLKHFLPQCTTADDLVAALPCHLKAIITCKEDDSWLSEDDDETEQDSSDSTDHTVFMDVPDNLKTRSSVSLADIGQRLAAVPEGIFQVNSRPLEKSSSILVRTVGCCHLQRPPTASCPREILIAQNRQRMLQLSTIHGKKLLDQCH